MSEENGAARFAVILAAAGQSSRFSAKKTAGPSAKKTFVHLEGKPLWLHSAEKFNSRSDVVQIVVVVAPEDIAWFRQYYLAEINRMYLIVVAGGSERVVSVRNALAAVSPKAQYVAVHDAARPCVTQEDIEAVFQEARKTGAALLASPVVGTLKRVKDGYVETTVNREDVWEAQTPQVFRRDILEAAYKQKMIGTPTDDSLLVELLDVPVSVVSGDRLNIKVTTPSDLFLARWVLQSRFTP
ncbi:2-C-methyl-D-erythritol 4-phosphate cytidylyltransferase [Planctomycetales bacterium]|nr:2-C-methyl-D-erythritol 4-phosphate cytidylyltransferase [Planctomycetales bacterium]